MNLVVRFRHSGQHVLYDNIDGYGKYLKDNGVHGVLGKMAAQVSIQNLTCILNSQWYNGRGNVPVIGGAQVCGRALERDVHQV